MSDQRTLVIFDIDGTLLFSNSIDSQCFATTYEDRYARTFPTIDWRKFPHVVDTTIFNVAYEQDFGVLPTSEEVHAFQDAFVSLIRVERQRQPEAFQPVPGAREAVLRLLADERYCVGIATGGWQRPAMVKLGHVGIPTDELWMSCADGHTTREQIIETVLRRGEAAPVSIGHTVYVGDAVWDVSTTRNLQMPFIGLRRKGDHEVLLDIGAQVVIEDYLDYERFLNLVAGAQPPVAVKPS
ncbi:MAG: HAD hydrolase-like protein [Bacteroidota bacterium]